MIWGGAASFGWNLANGDHGIHAEGPGAAEGVRGPADSRGSALQERPAAVSTLGLRQGCGSAKCEMGRNGPDPKPMIGPQVSLGTQGLMRMTE